MPRKRNIYTPFQIHAICHPFELEACSAKRYTQHCTWHAWPKCKLKDFVTHSDNSQNLTHPKSNNKTNAQSQFWCRLTFYEVLRLCKLVFSCNCHFQLFHLKSWSSVKSLDTIRPLFGRARTSIIIGWTSLW